MHIKSSKVHLIVPCCNVGFDRQEVLHHKAAASPCCMHECAATLHLATLLCVCSMHIQLVVGTTHHTMSPLADCTETINSKQMLLLVRRHQLSADIYVERVLRMQSVKPLSMCMCCGMRVLV